MAAVDPDERTTRLIGLLDVIRRAFETRGERRWAAWVARDAALLRAADVEGLRHFLAAFGGMGSIIDGATHPGLDEAYDLARALWRDHESSAS